MSQSPIAKEMQLDIPNALHEALEAHKKGCIDLAAAKYMQILAIFPDHFDANHLLGALRCQQGRNNDALDLINDALKQNQKSASALSNKGVVLEKLGRFAEAVASYDKALAIKPDYVEALNNRGHALTKLKRLEEAVASYDKALAIKPDYVEVLNDRGIALKGLKRLEEAMASYDKALAIKPDYAEAFNNRGNALTELKRLGEALASYDKALAIKPDYAETFNNRGNVLMELKRLEEAMASYDKALAIKPDYAEATTNRSFLVLLAGDFSAGWLDYESRWDRANPLFRRLKSPLPVWRGEPLSGKTIVVFDEQGFGDILQFCRYLPLLAAKGAKVTFLVRPSLVALMEPLAGSLRIVADLRDGELFDYQSALLSLPLGFGTTLATIPGEAPYLCADPERVERWKDRIGAHGFKIGIAWQGSRLGSELGKSFAPAELLGISRLPDVRLISLQKNEGVEQIGDLPGGMRVETLGDDFDAGPDAFLDTAAAMESLDLIISTDTSIAHLAGALGRPVWVALKHVPDWRWLLDRSDSPWYPTMRLFRQHTRDDWRGVFADVESALRELMGARSQTPHVPISWGELLDKITILEIKAARITDADKLRNVKHELDLLRALEARSGAASDEQNGLVAELKSVNEALWDIEDAIRECEHRQDFDAEFIELARSVYKTNDRRAEIKKKINLLRNSDLIEEKSYRSY
jgi:tetratricopeptide (TPR) repeat protein